MGRAADRQNSRREFLDSAWRAGEKRKGARVPAEARQFCEAYMGLMERAYPDEDDVHFVIDEFIEKGLPALDRYFAERTAAPGGRPMTETGRPQAPQQRRIYPKVLARRLRRLNFVAELVVPFPNLANGILDWGDRTIPWGDVAERWNQARPDQRTSAVALERAFRRDRNDSRLRKLYFDSDFRDWTKRADYLRRILRALEASGRRPEDLFVRSIAFDSAKLSDKLPPKTVAAFGRAGWPREWLAVSAKYPPERGTNRRQRTPGQSKRQRPLLLVCKGRACDSTSGMLVRWSPGVTTVLKGTRCSGCQVASLMMARLPSGDEKGAT